MITLEVRAADGKMEKWLVGGPAITRMEANGWTKTTVKPGDVLTGILLSVHLRPEHDQTRASAAGRRQRDAPLRPLAQAAARCSGVCSQRRR